MSESLISFSEKAMQKIEEYSRTLPEAKGKSFRVFVQGGGCSGFSYGFKFDDKPILLEDTDKNETNVYDMPENDVVISNVSVELNGYVVSDVVC